MPPQSHSADINPGLKLLVMLRWLALLGQIGLCLFSRYFLGMLLPWQVLIPCIAVTAITNIAAGICKGKNIRDEKIICGVLLFLDTLILTIMLYWTGGAHNPFATFYLLHIAIATILLSYRAAWGMVLFAGTCYGTAISLPSYTDKPLRPRVLWQS